MLESIAKAVAAIKAAEISLDKAEENLLAIQREELAKIERTRIIESYVSSSGRKWYLVSGLSEEEADSLGLIFPTADAQDYLTNMDTFRIFQAQSYQGQPLTSVAWYVSGLCDTIQEAIDCADKNPYTQTYPA